MVEHDMASILPRFVPLDVVCEGCILGKNN